MSTRYLKVDTQIENHIPLFPQVVVIFNYSTHRNVLVCVPYKYCRTLWPLAGSLAGWLQNPMNPGVRVDIGRPLVCWVAADPHGHRRKMLHRRAAGILAGWLAGSLQNPMRAVLRFNIDGPLAGWLAGWVAGWLAAEPHGRRRKIVHLWAAGWLVHNTEEFVSVCIPSTCL